MVNIDAPLAEDSKSVIRRSFRILRRQDKIKVAGIVVFQIFLGILDLVGIATIGAIGALSVNGISSKPQSGRIQDALIMLNLDKFDFQIQVAVLGFFATFLLVTRTLLSVHFQRKTLFFLSHKGSQISGTLFSRFINQTLTDIQSKPSQDSLFALTAGVTTITIGVIGSLIALISDGAVLLIVFLGLFFFNAAIAINTLIFFGFVALVLHFTLSKKAKRLGLLNTELQIKSNKEILEIFSGYRELFVRHALHSYSQKVVNTRRELSTSTAELAFLPFVSKYVLESSVVLGTLLICAAQFVLQDAVHAVATLAIFLSAGTRIAPAVLRMQQGALQIKSNIGSAKPTLDLIDALADKEAIPETNFAELLEMNPSIEIENISYRYPNSNENAIQNISLHMFPGSHTAIVGPSGAGKSTLVDLILGVINPTSGFVRISSLSPSEAVAQWPLSISYLPQEVCLIDGTISENLEFGLPHPLDSDRAWEVLRIVGLDEMFRESPQGLNSSIGERGTKLSGGQRQRLGIARALYAQPTVLVMDEATSALDSQTEAMLSSSIQSLRGNVTLVTVAHRLSTVVSADQVVYVENGKVLATGTFEEVRSKIMNFDVQANLLGL